MATIVYLDPDDEITSAASRIRAAHDSRIGLVLPFGSRVATSRINFRLLAREAQASGRRLDIVAPDGSARALAASAGLAVFSSVGEYEAALDADDEIASGAAAADGGTAPGAAVAAGPAAAGAVVGSAAGPAIRPIDPSRDTIPAQRVRPPVATQDAPSVRRDERGAGAMAAADDRTADRSTPGRRRARKGLVLLLVTLLLLAGAGVVAAVVVLPAADITVTPRIEPIGPISFTVTADPTATSVDPVAGVIPATTLDIPVNVSGDFKATGKRVEKTRATGAVRFSNCDPSAAYTLPRGTIVRTTAGTGFTIDEQVFLPVAGISGTPPNISLKCTTSEVTVTAVDAGPEANVGAGEIKVVPARYNRSLIRVTNPSATSGGARQEFPKVTREDVDAAVVKLKADALAQFQAGLADPATVPSGTSAFPETAALGEVAVTPDPAGLVDKEVETFTLAGTATGHVQAVDASPIEAIAEQRLQASIANGDTLVPGSITVDVRPGTVVNGLVSFPVDGSAKQVRPLDAADLVRQVRGLPKADAERALAAYGDVRIALWPGWVSSIPTLDQRVTLTVAAPVDETPASASPAPSVEEPSSTGSPAASVGASGSPSGGGSTPSPAVTGSPLEAPASDAGPSQPVPSG